MKPSRFITDTTLLAFGGKMRAQDRLALVKRLDEVGIHEIVLPQVAQKEMDKLCLTLHHATPALYVPLNAVRLQKALRGHPQSIHLEVPASYPMIYTAYRKNKDWLKKNLAICRDLLMEADVPVSVVLSDASRAEKSFLEMLVLGMHGLKIEKLIVKDLMGIQTLASCSDLVETVRTFGYSVGYEGNDQFGLSAANTIQALRAGASHACCCLGGMENSCDLRRLLQTTHRMFSYQIDRKGAEQLDRDFRQQYRNERLQWRQNNRSSDCRFC